METFNCMEKINMDCLSRYSHNPEQQRKLRSGFRAVVLTLLAALTIVPVDATPRAKEKVRTSSEAVKSIVALDKAVPSNQKSRVLSLTFKQLGASEAVQLRGVDGSSTFPFSVRSDEVVVAAKIKIDYSYSPSLLAELSHMKVLLNDEVASVVALPRDHGVGNSKEIALDPRLFVDYNKLQFRLVGHYAHRCEDPLHSSLWLSLSNNSRIELTLAPIKLAADLGLLPVPFFDKLDSSALKLPFVFASAPAFGTLKAAGIVSSWFGGLAGYRGAQFPVLLNSLPEGNAVVFLQGDEKIAGLRATSSATIAVEQHPSNPNAKILLVSGASAVELLRAARTLVLSRATLQGQQVAVSGDVEPELRKPYDAPAWIPNGRPVRFAELARLEDLGVRGYFPNVIRLNFKVSPDLFAWRSAGVPMELKYRFTPLQFKKNSSLNININGNFVHALALDEAGKKVDIRNLLKLPLLDKNLSFREEVLFVPPYQVNGRNQLQMQFYFDVAKDGECKDILPDNLQALIDPESTLDFSEFPHYSALPNLAFFANIGFPYTRMADLSQTAVVMPDQPNAYEIGAYLMLMGRMGEATGYPVLRHVIVNATELASVADRDLLVIGSGQGQSLMTNWGEHLPLERTNGERKLRVQDVFSRAVYRWEEKDVEPDAISNGSVILKGGGNLTSLMAFESPLQAKRSVVILYADQAEDLQKIGDTLNDAQRVASVRGDFVMIDDAGAKHAKVAKTYYVGALSWATHVRWTLSRSPLLTGLLGTLICILLAVITYRALRRVAAKRLERKRSD